MQNLYKIITVLSLLSSCTTIKDEPFCALIPENGGVVCDRFLTSNQQILSQAQWEALQAQWMNQGMAVECTTSSAIGDIKAEIEKLCSITQCDYSTQNSIVNGLEKMQKLGIQWNSRVLNKQ